MLKRLTATVHGKVQGVTYRDFTRNAAQELQLTGFVRNLPESTVAVIAEGEEHTLKEFLHILREKHPWARVERIEEVWSDATGEFDEFRIR